MDYKSSGVDIEAGREFVEKLKKKAPSIGGFNGMMKVPSGYKNPVLVSGTDGVGTKINICKVSGDYTTIGQDLVAMCVNDIITCGAKPLYFLDYISVWEINPILHDIMGGIIKGCEISQMDLLGGETAEHINQTEYDLAGFCTGIVEEDKIIDGSRIKPGDKVIGIESSGVHSNGYSLINNILWENKMSWSNWYDNRDGKTMIPELLTPTTIYAPLVNHLMEEVDILGMAHITGGGIPENLPRCLPKGVTVDVDYSSWERPDIFDKIKIGGDVEEVEMRNVFNLGIGFCLVVSPDSVVDTEYKIRGHGMKSWVIGTCIQS